MRVIHEVTLARRDGSGGKDQPELLRVRLWEPARAGSEAWCELRAEDGAGNLRFAFRDPRPFLVRREFETTLAELLDDYELSAAPCTGAG
ncbi:MAG: hypothetical protein ACYDA8_14900 [Deferrisomatales bacterium]